MEKLISNNKAPVQSNNNYMLNIMSSLSPVETQPVQKVMVTTEDAKWFNYQKYESPANHVYPKNPFS